VVIEIVNARQKLEPRSACFGTSANLTSNFYAFGPATQDTAGNTPGGQWTDYGNSNIIIAWFRQWHQGKTSYEDLW